MTTDRYISVQEAAALLEVTVAEVGRYIGCGLLDRYRLRGRFVRVVRSQVDELATVPAELRRIA